MTLNYDWCNCGPKGLSAGAIAGIVIGSTAGFLLLVGFVYWLCCKKDQYGLDESAVNAMEPQVKKSIVDNS